MEESSDAGSIPASSIICGKEGPGLPGGFLITYADAHPKLFGFRCVCSIAETKRLSHNCGSLLSLEMKSCKSFFYHMSGVCI